MFIEADATKRGSVFRSVVDRCKSAMARWNEMQRLDSREIEAFASARCARDLKQERRATPGKYCPNDQTLRALADDLRPDPSRVLPLSCRP